MENFTFSAHALKVINERKINIKWIESTINNPDKIEPDTKNCELEHRLKVIKANENRVLRVICNKSVKPILIVTAFFDRRLKGVLK